MLADTSAPGDNRDVHQVEVPEASQLCPVLLRGRPAVCFYRTKS